MTKVSLDCRILTAHSESLDHVLVTGATGFIGFNLCRILRGRGVAVTALIRKSSSMSKRSQLLEDLGVELIHLNNTQDLPSALDGSAFTAVFHLATLYLKTHHPNDIGPLIRANVEFGSVLMECIASSSPTFVSAESYFQFRDGAPEPISLYAATKSAFSVIANYYSRAYSFPLAEAVLFDTYGPGDTRDKIIPALVDASLKGNLLEVGPENQPLNLVHIDDVVEGLIIMATEKLSGRFQIRAPLDLTIGELVSAMDKISEAAVQVKFNDERKVNSHVYHTGSWSELPGWCSRISLEEGLATCLLGES